MRRRVWGVVLMMIVGAGATGCGGDSEPTATSDPTPSVWPQPTGSPVTIEPVGDIAGAEPYESDGVSVLVPDGWETRRTENPDYVMIQVMPPGDERNPVAVMVETQPGTADAVESTASSTFAQLATSGATDLEQRPATWSGWRYASSLTGVFDQGEGGVLTDFAQVFALSDSGMVVGVASQAPRGTLDDSMSSKVMRSVRPVG